MWFVISSEGTRIYLQPEKHLMFGRKKAEILLDNDTSVSKIHAFVTATKNKPEHKKTGSICMVQDLGSKYGTYISSDGGQFQKKDSSPLNNGDKIRFGLQNHIFSIQHVPLVTITSTISENEKEKLQTLFAEIDGVLSEEWSPLCTHLTVTCALLTEKVVWALESCIPIVPIAYWENMKQAIATGAELPDVKNFVPPIQENLINKDKVSLLPNEERKKLFNDLVFIFFSASQFKVYGKMVHLAGGKSVLFGKKKLTIRDLCLPNAVAVQVPDDSASQVNPSSLLEYEQLYEQMRSKSLRIVPDREIPLAILHCSIKSYCNPRHRYKLHRLDTRMPNLGEAIAPDTQDVERDAGALPTVISNVRVRVGGSVQNKRQLENVIIPETCDFVSGGDLNIESDVPEPTKKSPSISKRFSDDNRKAGDQNVGSSTEKKGPTLKKNEIRAKPQIQKWIEAYDISSDDDATINSCIIPETVEEPHSTTQGYIGHKYLSGRDVNIEWVVPEPMQKSSSVSKTHSDHKAGYENIGSNTEKKNPIPKKNQTPAKPQIQKTFAARDVDSSHDDEIMELSIAPESVKEPQPTTHRYANPNLKAGDSHFRSYTETQCPKLKESAVSAKSPITINVKEKVASPVTTDLQTKLHGIIIPETIDILNTSIGSSRRPVALSPEICISLIPKKKRVETSEELPERSLTLRASNEQTLKQSETSPVVSRARNTVEDWLAVMDNFTESRSNNPIQSPAKSQPRLSPAKFQTSNSEISENLVDKTPTSRSPQKRDRTPIEAEDVKEYTPDDMESPWIDMPKEKKAALALHNTVRNTTSNTSTFMRLHPVYKTFKKTKVIIPAQRITVKSTKKVIV